MRQSARPYADKPSKPNQINNQTNRWALQTALHRSQCFRPLALLQGPSLPSFPLHCSRSLHATSGRAIRICSCRRAVLSTALAHSTLLRVIIAQLLGETIENLGRLTIGTRRPRLSAREARSDRRARGRSHRVCQDRWRRTRIAPREPRLLSPSESPNRRSDPCFRRRRGRRDREASPPPPSATVSRQRKLDIGVA